MASIFVRLSGTWRRLVFQAAQALELLHTPPLTPFKHNTYAETTMIDLRSDTLTTPTPEMRAAMAAAEVGDDVFGEDPSVNRLERLGADVLGKEQALFLPSGTMANLIAFLVQTRPGDTAILCEDAHPYRFEGGNFARFGGLLPRLLAGVHGKLEVEAIAQAIEQKDDPHFSPTTLVSIENTTNLGGGAYYSSEEVASIGTLCRARGLRLHCDGARIFNAAIAQQISVEALAAPCDTVSFCLSKGLGAPVGSLLAGNAETIHAGRRVRKQLGGGMRQAGVLAAAGHYALTHHIDALHEDHRRARIFRTHLEERGVPFLCPSPTNILFLFAEKAEEAVARLGEAGVACLATGPQAIRVVFHRDITDEDLESALTAFESVLVP